MNHRIAVAAGLAAVVLLSACGRFDGGFPKEFAPPARISDDNMVHKESCVHLPTAGDIRSEKCVQDDELVSSKHFEMGGRKFLELCTQASEAEPVKCETYAQTGFDGNPPKD